MREICAEYGIEVVEEKGRPTLNGIPITDEDIKHMFDEEYWNNK